MVEHDNTTEVDLDELEEFSNVEFRKPSFKEPDPTHEEPPLELYGLTTDELDKLIFSMLDENTNDQEKIIETIKSKIGREYTIKLLKAYEEANGDSIVHNALKDKDAALAPLPAAKKPLGNTLNPKFASFNLLPVPLTVWLNFFACVSTFLNAVIAWVALTLSSTLETATTKK